MVIQRYQYVQPLVGPVQHRIVVQVDPRALEDRILTIDRQVVNKLSYHQHGQHRCTGNTLFNSPVWKLSDGYAFTFLANIFTTDVTLHVELCSLYFQYFSNFILKTRATAHILSRLDDDLLPAQR